VSGGGDDGLPQEEHEEHVNHEAWVIPYADLLTLLMAMFIALFAMSTVDLDKFKEFAVGVNEAFGGGKLETGVFSSSAGDSTLDGQGSGLSPQPGGAVGPDRQPNSDRVVEELLEQRTTREAQRSVERETLEEVEHAIEQRAGEQGLAGQLNLRLEARGLVVTVVTDQVLFDAGSADLRAEGEGLLRVVGEALQDVDNPILIEGHTDSVPISTEAFPSNWELSSGRAGSVARFFEALGVDRARLRPEGLADLFPIASNDTVEGRAKNRRVEIVVQSKLVDRALRDAGVSRDSPTTTTTPAVGAPVEDPVDNEVAPNLAGH
jgi:chemotaxis protein MotB